MRIIVLGGTRFIGRAIVEELTSTGHDLLIVHRGVLEPVDMPAVRHLHAERVELPAHRPVGFADGAAHLPLLKGLFERTIARTTSVTGGMGDGRSKSGLLCDAG